MIVLPARIRDALLERARAGAPEEVCGALGGRFDPDESRVTAHRPAANAAADPRRRYRLDPEELFEILEALEARGEEAVGFYHSHPRGPAGPSETDAARATWSDRSYLIVALGSDARLGSWRWRPDEGFERERIVVE